MKYYKFKDRNIVHTRKESYLDRSDVALELPPKARYCSKDRGKDRHGEKMRQKT